MIHAASLNPERDGIIFDEPLDEPPFYHNVVFSNINTRAITKNNFREAHRNRMNK